VYRAKYAEIERYNKVSTMCRENMRL